MHLKRLWQFVVTLSLTFFIVFQSVSAQSLTDLAGEYQIDNNEFAYQLEKFIGEEMNFLKSGGESRLILSDQGEIELDMSTEDVSDDFPIEKITFKTGLAETEIPDQYKLNLDQYELNLAANAEKLYQVVNAELGDSSIEVSSLEDLVDLMKLTAKLDKEEFSPEEKALITLVMDQLEEKDGMIYLSCNREMVQEIFEIFKTDNLTDPDLTFIEHLLEYIPFKLTRAEDQLQVQISLEPFTGAEGSGEAVLNLTFNAVQ